MPLVAASWLSLVRTMDAARRGSDEAFVDEWQNAEEPLSDVDCDAEEAERVAAVAGDARSIHRVVYRLCGRAGRRARQRRSAEVQVSIAVNLQAVLRCARYVATAGTDADVRPVPIEAAIDPCGVRSGASVVRRDGDALLVEAKGVSRGGPSGRGGSCGDTAGGGSPAGDDVVVGAAVVELDARQSNPFRKRQRTIREFMRASRASPCVPRGVEASRHGVPEPSRSLPSTLPTGHGHGSAAATRETGGIDAAVIARVAFWSTSGTTTAATDASQRAVPIVVLPAAECLPTASAYTSMRRSWRRVEGVASCKHTSYIGDTDDAHAAAASIMDKNGWTALDWNSDGSDASDDEPTHIGNRYRSREQRTFQMAQRAGVYAVVHALGDSPAVLPTLSEVLGETLPHMTHVENLV